MLLPKRMRRVPVLCSPLGRVGHDVPWGGETCSAPPAEPPVQRIPVVVAALRSLGDAHGLGLSVSDGWIMVQ